MEPMAALDASASRVVALLGQVEWDQWSLPTPCTQWDVRQLAGHVIAGMCGYAGLLHGAPAGRLVALAEQQATVGGDDPHAAAVEAAAAVRAAFDEPGALERTVHHPMGDLPGGRLLQMRIGDNVVHGWDLATALGLPADIDDALAEHVCAYLAPIADQLPATGYFAPPRRTLPPEASAQDRLLTMVGR